MLAKHFSHRRHWLQATLLTLEATVIENHVDRCRQVQAVMRRDYDKAMAKQADGFRQAPVFRPEHVECVFRVLEAHQRFRLRSKFDRDWSNRTGLEAIENAVVPDLLHVAETLHPLFAR
jgi:hypothetical protein